MSAPPLKKQKLTHILKKIIKNNKEMLKHFKETNKIVDDKFKIGYIQNDIISSLNKNLSPLCIIPFKELYYNTIDKNIEKKVNNIYKNIEKTKTFKYFKFDLSKKTCIRQVDNYLRNFINNEPTDVKPLEYKKNFFNLIESLKNKINNKIFYMINLKQLDQKIKTNMYLVISITTKQRNKIKVAGIKLNLLMSQKSWFNLKSGAKKLLDKLINKLGAKIEQNGGFVIDSTLEHVCLFF